MAKLIKSHILLTVLSCFVIFTYCSGSAIPMWEYLSKGEKMSHLYSMFAKQVSSYCKTNGERQPALCKRELLMHGLGKLQSMDEISIDSMDPYQRGATDIIWDSMMEGHPSMPKKQVTTQSSVTYPTGSYERNPLFDDHPAPKSKKPIKDMDYSYSAYPTGMDSVYTEPQNHLPVEAPTNVNYQIALPTSSASGIKTYQNNFLSGPMVVRVRPDGTPVDEDKKKPLPHDDDRIEMTIGKDRLPTMEQLTQLYRERSLHRHVFNPTSTSNYRIAYRTMNSH